MSNEIALGHWEHKIDRREEHNDPERIFSGHPPGITSQNQDVRGWIKNPTSIDKIRFMYDYVAGHIDDGDKVLDAGCYGGYFDTYLREVSGLKIKYTGIDLYEDAIEEAKALHKGKIDLRCQDAYTIKGKWDVVVASRLLMHVPRPQDLISQLSSVAKREFMFIVPYSKRDKQEMQVLVNKDEYLFWSFCDDTLSEWGARIVHRSKDGAAKYTLWTVDGSA
jgi:2-polyprenyl-3-methyl-5-hydroxy-6-metoxy-1,4-benzoquinol methylase